MSSYDLSTYSAALKVYYDQQKMLDMVYTENPYWALVPKSEVFGGSQYPVPVISQSATASATFAYAQSDQYAAQPFTFQVTRKHIYSIATVDNETLEAGATDAGAFMEPAKYAIDRAIRAMVDSIAMGMYRSGTGSQGSIASIGSVGTGVIALNQTSDVVFFEVGQTLQASSGDGSGTRAALGYVIAVNRALGYVVVSDTAVGGAAGNPSGWTTNDYLTVRGNINLQLAGVSGWVPTTAPTSSDSWFGVNRYNDVTRLGGVRYDGSSYNIQESLINGATLLSREGGRPTHCFMQHSWYGALINALGAKVNYVDVTSPVGIGFRGIRMYLANSSVDIFADRNCQAATAYLLKLDTWKFRSIGMAPKVLTYGGPDWLRINNQDAAELRYGMYGNLMCEAPGWNENITLGAL